MKANKKINSLIKKGHLNTVENYQRFFPINMHHIPYKKIYTLSNNKVKLDLSQIVTYYTPDAVLKQSSRGYNSIVNGSGSGGPVVERSLRDRGVPGSGLSQTANFLEQEIKPALLLSTQVYKWVPVRNI